MCVVGGMGRAAPGSCGGNARDTFSGKTNSFFACRAWEEGGEWMDRIWGCFSRTLCEDDKRSLPSPFFTRGVTCVTS